MNIFTPYSELLQNDPLPHTKENPQNPTNKGVTPLKDTPCILNIPFTDLSPYHTSSRDFTHSEN